jgi:hypothetical protein
VVFVFLEEFLGQKQGVTEEVVYDTQGRTRAKNMPVKQEGLK